MQKIDNLRNDIRKADKSRREYESRIDDVIAEATKVCIIYSLHEQFSHVEITPFRNAN